MALNFDHGAMPAATKNLEVTLDLNAKQLGWLGSLVFIGLFFGSVAGSFLFGKFPYKWILTVCCIGNTLGLFSFAYFTIYDFQCFARFCSGFCQIFMTIYLPVFINTIGTRENVTYYMSFFLLSSPLGVIVGYSMTAVTIQYFSWEMSFYIMAINMGALTIVMSIFDNQYIDIDEMIKQKKKI
jgi:MFS family permease